MTRSLHSAISSAIAMFCLVIAGIGPAGAREWIVGPHRALTQPSEAAARVADGDVVRIDPATYADCAIWHAARLRIEAAAPGVRLAGKTCAGKAIFVIQGDDVVVRGLTFADATVQAHNGAGIRAEGRNLLVEDSRFEHNENGILAADVAGSVLRITHSTFVGNGACIDACAHGVYAGGPIQLLEIEHCVFLATISGHHIKSRARNTVLRDNRIEDGPDGTASYLIDVPNGGNLLIQRNRMEKGPRSSNSSAAIAIGEEGVSNATATLVVRDNTFHSDLAQSTRFIRNATQTGVARSGNTISGNVADPDPLP